MRVDKQITVSSDALSEISDVTSQESRDEIFELSPDMQETRFRVDRRKLEQMLQGGDGSTEAAESFFKKIMEDTNTQISWPSRLKIGAKSKKDPHIRIAGRPEDVKSAKESVMKDLDTRSNRVTMKLDVSYTDHSHLIGRGGLTIKRVMEETGCHIHFPDSNCSNPNEKSNQVSIAGEMEGVEKARSRVRHLTPLIFSFELPITGTFQPLPDNGSPYIEKIQTIHSVQVMFKTRSRLHSTMVMVKGSEQHVQEVIEATKKLIFHMCNESYENVKVQMTMEISTNHHPVVLGKDSKNLLQIMSNTGTEIMFPDASDSNIPKIKKSNITITGIIEDVYKARHQLIGSLPLVLMCELREDVSAEKVQTIMEKLNVQISFRPKTKQGTLTVTIKGVEKHASNIYEARSWLLALKEPTVTADIPKTYFIPDTVPTFGGNGLSMFSRLLSLNTGNSPFLQLPSPSQVSPTPASFMPFSFNAWQPMVPYHSLPSQMGGMQQVFSHPLQRNQFTNMAPKVTNRIQASHQHNGDVQEWQSFSAGSSSPSSISSPSVSPRDNSPLQTSWNLDMNFMPQQQSSIHDNPERKAPGYEKTLERTVRTAMNQDYDQKRQLAVQAMKSVPVTTEARVPNSTWSGYGASWSVPQHIMKEKLQNDFSQNTSTNDLWPPQPASAFSNSFPQSGCSLSSSNKDDTLSFCTDNLKDCSIPDLHSLLSKMHLDRYSLMFRQHEVDLQTFLTLNEEDLKQIGVSAFGPRKKMLNAIKEFNSFQRTW